MAAYPQRSRRATGYSPTATELVHPGRAPRSRAALREKGTDGAARAAASLPRGTWRRRCSSGRNYGTVKAMRPDGARNRANNPATLSLFLRPGLDLIDARGLHGFCKWSGTISRLGGSRSSRSRAAQDTEGGVTFAAPTTAERCSRPGGAHAHQRAPTPRVMIFDGVHAVPGDRESARIDGAVAAAGRARKRPRGQRRGAVRLVQGGITRSARRSAQALMTSLEAMRSVGCVGERRKAGERCSTSSVPPARRGAEFSGAGQA